MHVDDLASSIANVATGAVATADDAERGPVAGGTTPVRVAGEPATWRDYLGTVTEVLGAAGEPGAGDGRAAAGGATSA